MRQILSTAVTALVVAALTAVSVGALAQSEPPAERQVTQTGLNADRVDGKHAVGFTNQRGRRANKLVATNKGGWLPSNIVQPYWGYIKNKPGFLADGQIGWNEVQGVPSGFADGVDNQGVLGITLSTRIGLTKNIPASPSLTDPNQEFSDVDCPAGSRVTGGGAVTSNKFTFITSSYVLDADTWRVWVTNYNTLGATSFAPYAVCMGVNPGALLTVAKRDLVPAKFKKRSR